MKTKNTFRINGIMMELEAADIDKDGKTGGTEKVKQQFLGITNVQEKTELGDALSEINKDLVEERLPSIDFRTRIDRFEMPPMVALDSLIGLETIPINCGILNRVKMRKAVSQDGLGRKEFVDVVVGKKQEDRLTANQKMQNFTGMNQGN